MTARIAAVLRVTAKEWNLPAREAGFSWVPHFESRICF